MIAANDELSRRNGPICGLKWEVSTPHGLTMRVVFISDCDLGRVRQARRFEAGLAHDRAGLPSTRGGGRRLRKRNEQEYRQFIEHLRRGYTAGPNVAVFHERLSVSARMTYLGLLRFVNLDETQRTGRVAVSVPTLAALTGLGPRTVRRSITQLEQAGLVDVHHSAGGSGPKSTATYVPLCQVGPKGKIIRLAVQTDGQIIATTEVVPCQNDTVALPKWQGRRKSHREKVTDALPKWHANNEVSNELRKAVEGAALPSDCAPSAATATKTEVATQSEADHKAEHERVTAMLREGKARVLAMPGPPKRKPGDGHQMG